MRLLHQLTAYRADWLDVGLIKITVFGAALCLAKVWPPLLSLDWHWYLIICLAAAVKPLVTFFKWSK